MNVYKEYFKRKYVDVELNDVDATREGTRIESCTQREYPSSQSMNQPVGLGGADGWGFSSSTTLDACQIGCCAPAWFLEVVRSWPMSMRPGDIASWAWFLRVKSLA